MVKVSKFDAADYLDNQETIAAYLSEALEPGDSEFLYEALATVARAKGMTNVLKENGLGRESLSKPEFDTVLKVIESFGLKLVAKPYTPPSS
jgi:probable addiction module antidote protein